ncbi:E3 ubiquitin-protein ligase TRIM32-like [Pecten maximus]|uniref:E3 ubiquitin-protein ligase TRIM32-like n=1 Tax=Pecten maximus TaxID=6579 RepID=UPI00145834DD|nr:E3 ubiquitin-protein ligase TRIM32-like [Pecten maximus]
MAEGRPVHEQLSVDSHRTRSLDSLVLQCPICLEQLRQPKSLPCLHSICQECLGSYITTELSGKMASASSFSCPVCRKVTEPVNPSEDKESWAEQFPTNNLAIKMTRHLQKTDEPIACKPCAKKGDKNVPANFWCKMNNTYFCAVCKTNIHDLFHEECEPENITDVNKSIMIRRETSVTECGKHEEKLEYYCEDHQLLGCSKCIIVNHRKCELVTPADDFRDNLSKNSKIDDLLEEIRKCVDAMEILITDVDEELQSMTQDQDSAVQSLTDLRRKINERFDTLQKELTEKLIVPFKEEKENLDISRKKCERLMFAMQNTLTSSKDVSLKDDTVGTIRLFQRGQAEVESCKGLLQELRKSSKSTSLRHEYDPNILALDTETSLTMGKIVVHQQQRSLPSTAYSSPLSESRLKMMRKLNMKVPSDKNECSLYGVVLLSSGRIVVSDKGNKKVKLFTEHGDLQCEMELTEKCCDLCRIDDNTVAVMLMNVKIICVINVGDTNLTISSKIKIPNVTERCFGVTYNNSFVVGSSTSLYSVPKDGGEATKIHTIESPCLHLGSNHQSGHVFAGLDDSTADRVAVTRLSDGTHTDVLKVEVVKATTGIDVDREGNVYVCGCRSNNVIQMSGDGTNVRELLTSSDGIKGPRAISVWGDKVVITFQNTDFRNVVHVLQLV